nr:YdcF family protein [Rubricella aquisinus]
MVVLSAGLRPDGTIDAESGSRARYAAALFRQGAAPQVIVTGGTSRGHPLSTAQRMADVMVAEGVPVDAITVEGASLSTLQNALFSKPLAGGRRILLVTEGTHMARSVLTFRWAGYDIAATAASPPPQGWSLLKRLTREGAAWGFNIARMALWYALGALGWSEEARVPITA